MLEPSLPRDSVIADRVYLAEASGMSTLALAQSS
jgi:hypothetical protein